jgi:predicted O-methyltransferase YrrM
VRAQEATPVSPEEGALLRWLAGRLPRDGIADVVEVGAAGGVGALHLIPALPASATLTVIEPDTNAHALAAEALEVAGHGDRVRTILGDPAEVLPRLSDARYGMCVLQGDPARYPRCSTMSCACSHPEACSSSAACCVAGATDLCSHGCSDRSPSTRSSMPWCSRNTTASCS